MYQDTKPKKEKLATDESHLYSKTKKYGIPE